jgi:hypothetical protein
MTEAIEEGIDPNSTANEIRQMLIIAIGRR